MKLNQLQIMKGMSYMAETVHAPKKDEILGAENATGKDTKRRALKLLQRRADRHMDRQERVAFVALRDAILELERLL